MDQGTRGAWPVGCRRDSNHTNRVLSIQSLTGGTDAPDKSKNFTPFDSEPFSQVAPLQQPGSSCPPADVTPTSAASIHGLFASLGHRADHGFTHTDNGFHDDIEEWLLGYGMPGAAASLDISPFHLA